MICIIEGFCTKNIEMKQGTKGQFLTFSIGEVTGWDGEKEIVEFHNIAVFNPSDVSYLEAKLKQGVKLVATTRAKFSDGKDGRKFINHTLLDAKITRHAKKEETVPIGLRSSSELQQIVTDMSF